MSEGPFVDNLRKVFESNTEGVSERTLTEYKNVDGVLWKYEYTRKYFENDYVDSNVSKCLQNGV
jgi:hypothetical protein